VVDDAVSGDRLVSEYLSQLHAAAWVLPADRRTVLVDDARRRLYAEIGDDADPARTRAVIASLGPPEDAVRREAETLGPSVPVAPRPFSVWGSREVAAVLLLAVGGLALPIVGPVVGLALAWLSDRWTTAQRLVATVLAVVPLVLLAVASAALGGGSWIITLVTVLVPLAGLVPAGYLAAVLRRQAAAMTVHGSDQAG
jgi:hypothetical protein